MRKFFFFILVPFLPFFLQAKIVYVPYQDAFYPDICPDSETGALFKAFYDAFQNQVFSDGEYLIPPLIHFIWLGSEIPQRVMRMVETWEKWHPEWTVKIWTDEDVPAFGMKNQKAFDAAINFGEKSDIFRYEILYRFGGVYIDADFECLQAFDSLHQNCEFYAGLNRDNRWIFNGMIGAKKGHSVIKACMDNIKSNGGNHDSERIMQETGPYFFTRTFLAMASQCDPNKTVIFPPTFFYPFPGVFRYSMDAEEAKRQFVRPESLCIHYWHCSWQR